MWVLGQNLWVQSVPAYQHMEEEEEGRMRRWRRRGEEDKSVAVEEDKLVAEEDDEDRSTTVWWEVSGSMQSICENCRGRDCRRHGEVGSVLGFRFLALGPCSKPFFN